MTKEELAAQLNGREIGDEITPAEEKQAKADGLVVIFGASDDLCELRGAINDEVGCYNGGEVLIGKDGKILPEMEDGDIEVLKRHGLLAAAAADKIAIKIEALWCESEDCSWTYKTDFPHATFDVMEDGEKFCVGLVFDLKDMETDKAKGAVRRKR